MESTLGCSQSEQLSRFTVSCSSERHERDEFEDELILQSNFCRLQMKGIFVKHDKSISTAFWISTYVEPELYPARHAGVGSRVSSIPHVEMTDRDPNLFQNPISPPVDHRQNTISPTLCCRNEVIGGVTDSTVPIFFYRVSRMNSKSIFRNVCFLTPLSWKCQTNSSAAELSRLCLGGMKLSLI